MENSVYIGIGSNIGSGIRNCLTAIRQISHDRRVSLKTISSFYSTSPVSDVQQNDFVNCAIQVAWDGTAKELLDLLLEIEHSLGRTRDIKNGPRIIDLDILLFGDSISDDPVLTIPHKELHNRKFALVPCIEMSPGLKHPRFQKSLESYLSALGDDQTINRLSGVDTLELAEED